MKKRQLTCENGHYYDASYNSCPMCNTGTVLLDIGGSDDKPQEVKPVETLVTKGVKTDNNKTMYIKSTKDTDDKIETKIDTPQEEAEVILAGWLVIISGKGKGKSFEVTFGFNTIGRGDTNHISISNDDNSISREKHSSIIYDYSNNRYFIKHEEGKFLTYLNGDMILDTKELKAFDKITLGNTELLFVPLCGDNFQWEV